MADNSTKTIKPVGLTDEDLDQIEGGGVSKAAWNSTAKGGKTLTSKPPQAGNPGDYELGDDFAP